MRVLLTDGSGLTSKQVAHRLGTMGHRVEVLAPNGLCLSRFSRYVRNVHPVPAYGPDPFAWLEAALSVWAAGHFDVLFPTQEQVAVLSFGHDRLIDAGVTTIVPEFDALAAVQDKVSAHRTLAGLDLPQPRASVVTDARELAVHGDLPAFVKLPIGTATSGVQLVRTRSEAAAVASVLAAGGVFDGGAVLVQQPVSGPLVMVQSVFDHGELVAFHACERLAEGTNGGASHKQGVSLPATRHHLEALGASLGWHGGLSVDVIVGADGPLIIDVNPRLVEPANAAASGVDLVGTMMEIARGGQVRVAPEGRPGVRTHQLLLAVLGAAERGGRSNVLGELVSALRHTGGYRDSTEELSPLWHDALAAVPVAAATLATLARPAASAWFTSGSVSNYALTPGGWRKILEAASLRPEPDWPR